MPITDYTPSLAQVGALVRTRTKDDGGNEIGTFSAQTRPTDADVNELITQAVDTLSLRAGVDIPPNLFEQAKRLAAFRAAMLIEISYFPEQVKTGRSPYSEYMDLWKEGYGDEKTAGVLIQAITSALQDGGAVKPTEPGLAVFAFPPAGNIGNRPW